jgi:uncharacterized protein (TIGR00730 family)
MKKIYLLALLLSSSVTSEQVAVFCSADNKVSEEFKQLAFQLGAELAQNNFGLVTGGSDTGLMKEVVDGYAKHARDLNKLYGILPEALAPYKVEHPAIPESQLIWTKSMHARLEQFHAYADIIVVLPGGFGTLHEFMDFLVHNQFGLTKKMILILNINGYWDGLITQFEKMREEKLLSASHMNYFSAVDSVEECMGKILCAQLSADMNGLDSLYWEKNK